MVLGVVTAIKYTMTLIAVSRMSSNCICHHNSGSRNSEGEDEDESKRRMMRVTVREE